MEVEGVLELPAESNPLSESLLIHALRAALSGDNHQLITSKQQLEEWQSKPGYHQLLQSICEDKRLPYDVRFQAIIQIKNSIEKNWRRGAKDLILDAEKAHLRPKILYATVQEHDRKLATINALTVAKIARLDFPTKWPDPISILIELIRQHSGPEFQSSYPIQLRRALLVLLHITKEITQIRIGPAKPKLNAYSSELLMLCGSIFFKSFQSDLLQAALQNLSNLELLEIAMEQSFLSLRIIRKLLLVMDHIRDDSTFKEFWNTSLPQFQSILNIVVSSDLPSPESSPAIALLYKNLRQMAKLHVQVAHNNFTDFVLLQTETFEVVRLHWQLVTLLGQQYALTATHSRSDNVKMDDIKAPLLDNIGHQALLLLRACIQAILKQGRGLKYRTPEEKIRDKQAIDKMASTVFTDASIIELLNHVVMELLVLQPKDFQEWEEDPEEWEKKEEFGSADYEFATRPCAEKLLYDLIMHYKHVSKPELNKMLEIVTAEGYSNIILKDAVYCALSLAAPFLDQHLDFKGLMITKLIPEIQIQSSEYKLLRRRIAMLVGNWSTVEDSKGCRPIYFQIFQHLLNRNDHLNDIVVRITAGRYVSYAVNSYECKPEDFQPFAEATIGEIMNLVREVEVQDTKLALLNSLSTIVDQLEKKITPFADSIVSMLPKLWDDSGEDHFMKQTVLSLLSRLFFSMKEDGQKFHGPILPLIQSTLIPDSPLRDALLEDTLDLWCTIISQTPTAPEESIDNQLYALIDLLIPLLEADSEIFEKVIEILNGYILLAPKTFISHQIFNIILHNFATNLKVTKPIYLGMLINMIENSWQAGVAVEKQGAAQEMLLRYLNTGFLDAMLQGLQESWDAHQTTGPKAIIPVVQGMIETDIVSVIARAIVDAPDIFIEALQKSPVAATPPTKWQPGLYQTNPPIGWLFDEWFSHVEDFGDPERRKLMAMALTKLIDSPHPFLLGHMQSLMSLWTSVVSEIRVDEALEGGNKDGLVWREPAQEMTDSETNLNSPVDKRKRKLAMLDPVHTEDLVDLIQFTLRKFIQRVGGEQAFHEQILVNIDQNVIDEFVGLKIM